MITDLNRTVAYRCPVCGELTFASISMFELINNTGIAVSCRCGRSNMKLEAVNRNNFTVILGCVFCDKAHKFSFSFKDIAYKKSRKFTCPSFSFNIGVAYIGKMKETAALIEADETYINDVSMELSLDGEEKNTVFLLKAIDKIRSLASEGQISCACGSVYIDVDISATALYLVCENCGKTLTLPLDFIRSKKFSELEQITLGDKKDE